MNKTQLIAEVARKTGTTKTTTARTLDAVLAAITLALKKKDKVMLMDFGTFHVRQRKARLGLHPKTGKPVKIKASKIPAFKYGKALKDSIK